MLIACIYKFILMLAAREKNVHIHLKSFMSIFVNFNNKVKMNEQNTIN